jgi:phosphatidylserine decarboxylase
VRTQILRIFEQEDINFLLTNRIPRRLATQFIGWFSRVEQRLVRDLSIATWRLFSDLDLTEAKQTRFRSLHDCFIRELKDGARPIDGADEILVSPCDAIVGACGKIEGTGLYQAKGFPYTLQDLLCDQNLAVAALGNTVFNPAHAAGSRCRFRSAHIAAVQDRPRSSGAIAAHRPADIGRR